MTFPADRGVDHARRQRGQAGHGVPPRPEQEPIRYVVHGDDACYRPGRPAGASLFYFTDPKLLRDTGRGPHAKPPLAPHVQPDPHAWALRRDQRLQQRAAPGATSKITSGPTGSTYRSSPERLPTKCWPPPPPPSTGTLDDLNPVHGLDLPIAQATWPAPSLPLPTTASRSARPGSDLSRHNTLLSGVASSNTRAGWPRHHDEGGQGYPLPRYPAWIDGEQGAYAVPDLPGIVAMRATVNEALMHAKEALRDYVVEAERAGEAITRPSPFERRDARQAYLGLHPLDPPVGPARTSQSRARRGSCSVYRPRSSMHGMTRCGLRGVDGATYRPSERMTSRHFAGSTRRR